MGCAILFATGATDSNNTRVRWHAHNSFVRGVQPADCQSNDLSVFHSYSFVDPANGRVVPGIAFLAPC